MNTIIGQLLALGTALCWAQNSLIYAHVGKLVSSSTTAHIRLWIAFPLVMLVHLLFEGTLLPLSMPRPAFLAIAVSGLLGFFIADLFIFEGLASIGARRTMVLMTTSPLFGALLARLLREERLMPLQVAGMLVTIGGVLWVVAADRSIRNVPARAAYLRGVGAALGGAAAQALALIFAKAGMVDYDVSALSANSVRIGAGWAGLIVFALVRGTFFRDFGRFQGKEGRFALKLVLAAAFVGPVFGIALSLQALKMAPLGIVTTLSQTTPIILLPIEILVLKHPVSRGAVFGTLTAIAGTAMLFLPAA